MKKHQPILNLKPTQFALGMLEIEEKVHEMQKFGKHKLKKFIKENPIPVVISPEKELFMTDHHHLLFSLWHIGVTKVDIKIIADLSSKSISYTQFWKWMKKKNLYYAFCQFGEGPRHPMYLPVDIRGLADDPYRSLAWFVRKAGGYENSTTAYAEFDWANFFRKRRLLDRTGRRGINKEILKKTLRIAKSPEAKKLPGYLGPKR